MLGSILRRNALYEQDVEQLLSEMSRYGDERLNRRPANGGWSAMQTMHHLILSEEGSLQYAHKKINAPANEIGKAGLASLWRSAMIWVYLTSPLKFKAPRGVSTEFLPETATFAETAVRWRAVRAAWRSFFEQLPPDYADRTVYKHPFAGRLDWHGVIRFFSIHQKRHLKQMRRAIG